ncbi:MAG: type II secretion system protein GspN, partial [Candidatus Methylomirabilis sp.]|nr:type II secretion system protein GspN [Deltaproteobacteria bacterium]
DRVVLRSRELNGAPILGVQDVSARLSVLGLLTGKLKGSAGGDLLGGRLDADAALARTGGKRVAVKARDLDLGRLTYLKERFDTRLEGKIGADIDLDLLDPQPENWSGGGTLDLTGLKLLEVVAAGFPVPPLSFETVHAELDVKDGKAVVKRTRVQGAEIDEARLSGDIALSQQIGMSTLNLVAKLRPNPALEEQWGSMFSNFLRKKDADGFYSLYLRGPLSAPKISKSSPSGDRRSRADFRRRAVASFWSERYLSNETPLGSRVAKSDRMQALEEETARLRAIVEAAVDAIITIDDRGAVESFNPAAERLFGYAAAEIVGRNVSTLMPEPYRREHDGYIANYKRTGVRKIIGIGREVVGRRKDGSTFPMDLAVSETHVGERRLFTGIVRDLTERKLHEERFRLAVESSPNGMVMADEAGRIVMINAAAEDLFGFTRDELIGREIETLVPERFRTEHPRLREIFGKKPESRRMGAGRDLFALRKDGTEFPVEIGLNPIRTAAGTYVLSSIIDITERKQAEEQRRMMEVQLQQTQKLESLGVLAGGIAHDFNNLLVGILGNVELAIDDLPSNSPALGPLEDVVLAAKRLADLCKQMLAYSGKGRFVVAPVSLNAIVEEMSHLLSASISKKVLLKFRLAPNLPEINADATQIRQIVMNLIVNASDAIGDRSGAVTVTTGAMECDRAYLSETFFSEGLPEGRYVFLE